MSEANRTCMKAWAVYPSQRPWAASRRILIKGRCPWTFLVTHLPARVGHRQQLHYFNPSPTGHFGTMCLEDPGAGEKPLGGTKSSSRSSRPYSFTWSQLIGKQHIPLHHSPSSPLLEECMAHCSDFSGTQNLAISWTNEPYPGADFNKLGFTIILVLVIPLFWCSFVSKRNQNNFINMYIFFLYDTELYFSFHYDLKDTWCDFNILPFVIMVVRQQPTRKVFPVSLKNVYSTVIR